MTKRIIFQRGAQERWKFTQIDQKEIQSLADSLHLDPLLARLLLIRKIPSKAKEFSIDEFLAPTENCLYEIKDITSEKDMKLALDRLIRAIKQRERIVVNGDPDADGITGTTVLSAGLTELGADVIYKFPIRATEGHGIQPRIIDEAKSLNAKVILTVDCGSHDVESTEYANSLGLDVIICDHHTLGRHLPPALCIVNPFRVEKHTLMKSLSGAGIAYKLILALFQTMGKTVPRELFDYLTCIAALGTVSDRMSLLNPINRMMLKNGVDYLNSTTMEGLKALKEISVGSKRKLKPRDIARTIVPRLNAPGRIGNPRQGILDSTSAVDLLLIGTGMQNAAKAQKLAEQLSMSSDMDKYHSKMEAASEAALVDDINERRKYITSKIEDEIDKLIKDQVNPKQDRIIIVKGKNWNPGVIGIDTDRLKERFLRPAMILTEYEGSDFLRGSVRSIPTINMYKVIEKAEEIFEVEYNKKLFFVEVETANGMQVINAFGGHAQACGFTVHKRDMDEFIRIVKVEMDKLKEHDFEYSYEILDTLQFSEINRDLLNKLDQLLPYGQEFEFPTFYLKDCLISKTRAFGNKYQQARTPHAEFVVANYGSIHKGKGNEKFMAVGFGLWEKINALRASEGSNLVCDIIFTLEESRPRGKKRGGNFSGAPTRNEIRLNVLDIRASS